MLSQGNTVDSYREKNALCPLPAFAYKYTCVLLSAYTEYMHTHMHARTHTCTHTGMHASKHNTTINYTYLGQMLVIFSLTLSGLLSYPSV